MADLDQTIRIILNGIDNTGAAFKTVGDNLGKIDAGLTKVAAPLADLADKIIKAETAVIALGAALGVAAANEAQKFETSFRLISTVIDAPLESLQDFKQSILEYAQISTLSLDDIGNAVNAVVQNNIEYGDSLKFVQQAEKLSVATGATLAESTTLLLRTTEAYRETNLDAATAAAQLFKTVDEGVITIPQLSEHFGQLVGIAAQSGVSLEELSAGIATLTYTMEPEQAITALKNVINGIIAPSKEASDAASEMGINFSASAIQTQGFSSILQDIMKATGGSADEIVRLFGDIIALGGVMALTNDNASRFVGILGEQKNAAEAFEQAYGKMAGILDTGADAVKVLAIQFGGPLLDAFYNSKSALTEIFNALADASRAGGPMAGLQQIFVDAGATIESVLKSIQGNITESLTRVDFGGIGDSLGDLADDVNDLFKEIFGDIDIRTVDGLASAIQTVVNTFESLTRVTSGIAQAFLPVADAIGETAIHFNDLDTQSKIDFGETIGSAKVLIDIGTGLGLALIAIGKAGVEMGAVLDAVFGGSKVAINALQVAFDTAALGILKSLQGIAGTFGFDETAKELQYSIDAVWENALKNSEELKGGWRQAMGEAGSSTDDFRARLDAAEKGLISARDATSSATNALAEINQQASGGAIVWDSIKKEWIAVGEAADKLNESINKSTTETRNLTMESRGFITVSKTLEGGIDVLSFKTEKSAEAWEKNSKKTKEATKELDGSSEATKDLAKQMDDYMLKIRELDNELQTAKLEAFVSIRTAEFEADAERVKATFASIDNTISSTGEVLSGIFDAYVKTDDRWKESEIESQIKKENGIRRETLDMQKQLAQAEIQRIQAQTEAMARGDGIITISADGLEPEIEAFMWKILQNIRVRANAEFQDYLLGMGAA